MGPRRGPSQDRRFWAMVDRSGDCWNWIGAIQANGYGRFKAGARAVLSHRYAYEAVRGPIPAGLVIDHLCRNRACCNPDHLEAVSYRTNTLRGTSHNAIVTQTGRCIRGHDMAKARVRPTGERECRRCESIRKRRSRAAKRQEVLA